MTGQGRSGWTRGALQRLGPALLAAGVFWLTACELVQPEVVVENALPEPAQICCLSISGCYWPDILAPGKTTSPQRCLPGADRVHFKRFDVQSYLDKVLENYQKNPEDFEPVGDRVGFRLPTPLWFNYQTLETFDLEYGSFVVLRIEAGSIEQDFSAPGPYGH